MGSTEVVLKNNKERRAVIYGDRLSRFFSQYLSCSPISISLSANKIPSHRRADLLLDGIQAGEVRAEALNYSCIDVPICREFS